MISIHWSVLAYTAMQISMFGLLIGLGAEQVDSARKAGFLWLLAWAWPVIVAWKILCQKVKP